MAFDLKKLLEDGVKTFGNAVGQGAQAVGNFFNKDVAQPVGNFVNNANKNFVQPAVNNTVKAVNTVSDNVNPLDQDFQHNVVKSIGDYFNPVADKVRVRDVVREIPSVVGKYVSGEGIYGNAQEAHQAAQDFNNWHGPKVGPDIFGKSLGEQVTDNIVKPAVNTFNTLGSMTEIVPKAIRGGIEQLSGQDGALAKRVATPYAFEATNNVGSARTGQDNTTLTPDETRKTVWAAAQAPLYMFSGAKGLGSTEGNLGARVLSRSTSVIPEAAINAAGQTYAEGDINKLPENMLTSYLTMAALSNATGGASDLTKGFINKVKSGEGIPVGLSIQDINKAFSNAKTPEAVQNIAQNAGVSLTKSQVNRLVKETDPTKINGILYPPTAAPVVPGETPVKTPEQMSLDMSGKPPVEPPVSTVPAGNPEKPFGFNNSAKGSEFVSPEAKAQLEGGNPTRSNIELQNTVAAKLDGMDAVKAHDFALKTNSDEGTAAAIQLAQQYRKSGQFDLEAQLINEKARRLREAGREVQAARLVDELSPEGTVANAANLIQKYNETAKRPIPELTGDLAKQFSDRATQIAQMPEGRQKQIELFGLKNDLLNLVPSSTTDKAIAVWKAGLLTSLRTHERNIVGNSIMLGSEVAKNVPGSFADRLMSLRTGQRTMTNTLNGLGEFGSKKTRQEIMDLVKLGFDPNQDITKFDMQNHITWADTPVQQMLKKYTDAVFRPLGAEDKAFFNSKFANSLYDQAGAAAINAGKKGDKAFIKNLVDNPTESMLVNATKDANYATFHDKNALGSFAANAKNFLASQKGWKGEVGKAVSEIAAPFTGVPSSIVGKTVSYSPVGLIKGMYDVGKVMAKNVPDLQRQAAQEIGRGVMGTGLFGIGAYLASKGLMTGQPKDKKEADLWAAEGKQANSVLIGGKWRSVNSIGPQNLVMLAGAKAAEETGKKDGSVATYMAGLGKDQLSQTFLAGVQGPLNAVTDPARYGTSYVGGQASSVIPNIVKDTAKAFDSKQRETNGIKDYFQNSIPGWRNTNTVKRDVLGNEMKQEPTGVAAFIDLFNSKTPTNNPVANELGRLYGTGNDATPSAIGKNALKKYGVENMTPEQLDAVEKESGGLLSPTLQNLMNTPTYQSATDEEKAKAISSTVEAVRTKAKGNVVLGQTSTGTGGTGTGLSADTSKISKSANTQLDKLSFENSGKNYMEKDGMVYRRDAQGNITATPKVKFDYQVGQSQLTRYKNQNDMGNWMKVADTQLKSIQEQLKDPSIDPLDKIQLQNDADTLYTNMMKYKDYGGFSKPKSGSSKAKSLLSNDIKNSVTNSTLSDLHNLLAGTIGNKATAQRQLGQKVQLRKVKGA